MQSLTQRKQPPLPLSPSHTHSASSLQNSIRHNLSLNPAFRKVKDSLRWQGKKGYYWEVVPERWSSVEREVERYLRQEGKLRSPELNDGSKCYLQYVYSMCIYSGGDP